MSAAGMIAFQTINLSTDFEFDNFYRESLYAEICEKLHGLGKEGVNIFDPIASREAIQNISNQYPDGQFEPDPVWILVMEARQVLNAGTPAYNYLKGASLLQPMKDYLSDAIKFASDSIVNPLTDSLVKPILFIGVPSALIYLAFKHK